MSDFMKCKFPRCERKVAYRVIGYVDGDPRFPIRQPINEFCEAHQAVADMLKEVKGAVDAAWEGESGRRFREQIGTIIDETPFEALQARLQRAIERARERKHERDG